MQLSILFGALGAIVVQATTALAAPPSWCREGRDKPLYDLKTIYTEKDPWDALRNIVAASCYPDDDAVPHQKQIAATKEAWSKRMALTESDWAEVAEWAHYPSNIRGSNTFFVKDKQTPWNASSPLDQFGLLSSNGSSTADIAYVADAFGDKLSQLGRVGYVTMCMSRMTQDDGPVAAAMCAADAASLDMAKIAAEVRADNTHGIDDKMTARLVAYQTISQLPAFNAYAKELRDKDDAYKTMFTLADSARQKWTTVDAKLVALATDLDAARISGSRKAAAGCADRSLDAWAGVVGTLGAKQLGAIKHDFEHPFIDSLLGLVIKEPNGYLAALAINECAKLEGKDGFLSETIGAALSRWPGFRGPRTGAQTAIVTAGLQLDQRDKQIDYPDVDRGWIQGVSGQSSGGWGAMAEVKVEGEKAILSFAKQKVRQTRCVKGHTSNQVRQIMSDGSVTYWYICDKEIDETIEVSPFPPMKIKARYAAGLKPGMTVHVSDDTVVVAYPKGSTTPALVTGVVVK